MIFYISTKVACNSHTGFHLGSIFFSFFLFNFIFSTSFLLDSFRINLPLLPIPLREWHNSMFSVSTSTSFPRKTHWKLSSKALSVTYSGMPEVFRRFLLEYCSLPQNVRSVTIKRSTNFTFTFRDIGRSDSILVNLIFASSNSAFIEFSELRNLCWQSSTILANSSLVSLFRDEREYAML